MNNAEISAAFQLVADILEFQAANPFRVRAYQNAARTIQDLHEPLEKIAADPQRELTDLPGIGKDLSEKIHTLVESGSLPMLEELKEQVPQSVLAMLRIPGLGPKKAAVLHKELGIHTLEQLKVACQECRVRELKGFGEKTEAAILAGLDFAASPEVLRMYWAKADVYAEMLVAHLKACRSVKQIDMAGSYRRGRETIGDLDAVVESKNAKEVMDRFAQFDGLAAVLGAAPPKCRSAWASACKSTCASSRRMPTAPRWFISPAPRHTTWCCEEWPKIAA